MTAYIEDEKKLRVFLIEDNPDDVELELYELEKGNISVTYDIARNRKDFIEKIAIFKPDIILADYALPDITGIEAINIIREIGIDAPVILITGEGNETIAVDSLRLGAIDYILKRNISGLSARVKRALEIWADRKAKERAEAEEMRLQQLLYENQKMDAIGRLAGGIAHDFNNLLTGIIGFSEISLIDIPPSSSCRNNLESIISLAQKGAELVKQLLIFSRKMAMEFRLVDINSFISETVYFLRRIVEASIEIRLEAGIDIPMIRIDTSQFTQVLMNLILNAKDAMNGKGIITIKTFIGKSIDDEKHGSVFIQVSDTGTGIDEQNMTKIFDPFFTTKEVGKGTGLGLSIVYSVVKAHGGDIRVSSKKGEGTTFTIELPLTEDVQGDDSPFYSNLSVKQDAEISGSETLLIVEDEDVLREMLSNFMRGLGYSVFAARDGKEAFALFEKKPERFNLIISDMTMPNMGGIELFKRITAIKPDISFILVTGYSLADVDQNILAEMTAIQKKPYTPLQIAKLVRSILDVRSIV